MTDPATVAVGQPPPDPRTPTGARRQPAGPRPEARRPGVHPQLVIGAVLVGLVVVTALVSLVWTPFDPEHAGAERLLSPGAEHWLGTDRFGRDVFSQVMAGARITLLVGLVAVGIAAVVGVPLGVLAGMRGGRLGVLLMRGSDILLAFPGLLLAIVLGAVYGAGTVTAMVALGIGSIPAFARVARSGTLQVMRSDYVVAARAANRGERAIAARHVLPNIAGTVLVQCSVNFAIAVLAEAGLSFLGLGTPPPTPSWGRMLQESQQFLGVADHLAIVPGVAIAVAVLGFNLLGDGLRDVFDPRLSAVGPHAPAGERPSSVSAEPVGTTRPSVETPALDIRDLTVRTDSGRALLSEVSLRVGPGERVGLIGESGSGKTMTALAALGLLPDGVVATGQVGLAGVPGNLLERGERALAGLRGEALSMVFQEPMTALNPLLRVGRQVAETMTLHGATSRTATRRAAELLAEVGLPDGAARRYPHELSGGQRQRVVLAMALANDPAVLVADEPTTALDVTVQRQMLDLMVRLVEDRGAGLLFITHDLAVVSQVCQRVVVLLDGVVVEEGTVAQVFAHPRHEYTRRLLAASTLEPRTTSSVRSEDRVAEPLIRVEDVTRTYQSRGQAVHALGGVSLEVQEGQRFGIVGESGSGKSTLLRIVAGLDRATSGRVTSAGVHLPAAPHELGDLRAALQLVFQDPYGSLDPRMTVGDIVAEPLLNPANVRVGGPRTASARRDAVREMLDAVGLPLDATERYPHQFSGGQRQRIAIARALVCRPRILVADEPVSALDVSVRRQVLDLLARLADEHALTLLLVSHDLGVVRHVCDHVAVMRDGLIVEQGPADQVYDHPQHEYTRTLRDATPVLRR
ncbi:dipeptide ABC transporter ATP-binding protein [Promicromonospora iranensis]|uniref:ABC-type glutathione transport system ATPase component/ABC-type dipeptide/oligopeptide/nickel transport system permease subunit n=1 Tax=Promicromonospora iranensis TaxID=1105144 RepID=A0ABU2CNZ4_9MICO|nr:dipeptide ABC transporter ATP-binding protein [Promicromonospora iranensis]MDR7383060.1 ABC-type glutathione transport system ATPase component/ABC-type dipeptide/oligopeptide/nickel transport system permease subunit [Promicromonospora iranensis]